MSSNDEEFKDVSELKVWLERKGVGERVTSKTASTLFGLGFYKPSSLLGISSEQLERCGLSIPSAVELSNKLKQSQEPSDVKDLAVNPPSTPTSSNAGNASDNTKEGAIPRIRQDPIQPAWMETSAVELLQEGIRKITSDISVAPFIFLVQSMGYGKTKAVFDLATKRRVVYLPCKDVPTLSGDDGFWKIPTALRDTIDFLQEKRKDRICESKWTSFLTTVKKLANSYSSARDLYNAQITADGKLGDFYQKLNYNPVDSPLQTRPSILSTPKKTNKRLKTENCSTVRFAKSQYDAESSLVVCLDGSTALAKTSFLAFCRAAKWVGIIVIFSDTTVPFSILGGADIGILSPPIYRLPNFDLEWNPRSHADDLENLFKAGRPLWSSFLQIPDHAPATDDQLDDMVEEVEILLTRYANVRGEDISTLGFEASDVLPCIAVFTCRFGLGYKSTIGSLLAKYSFATIAFVSETEKHARTHFPSEPVLAEASIRCTMEPHVKGEVLRHVHAAVKAELLLPPRGDLGEMCAAALMGFTMDKIRQRHRPANENPFFYSGLFVDLHEFLKEFGCSESDMVTRELKGWKINFTHFVLPARSTDRRDLEVMWVRRVAFYVQEGTRGLDLLIAIHHETHGYATLRVQVENRAEFPNSKRDIAFTKLAPTSCPPFVDNEKLSVCLLLCTKVEPHCTLWDYNVKRQLDPAPQKDTQSQANEPEVKRFCLRLASEFVTDANREDGFSQRLLEISSGKKDETEDEFWRVDEPVLEWEKIERDEKKVERDANA